MPLEFGVETEEHRKLVSDYKSIGYFEKKLSDSGYEPPFRDADVFVFYCTCSDSRNRSTRLDNAYAVLKALYEKHGNRVEVHALEVAGSTFYLGELEIIRSKIAKFYNKSRREGRKPVFLIEGIGHSGVIKEGNSWHTDPSCSYHCGMTHGESVGRKLQELLLEGGYINIPRKREKPIQFKLGGEDDLQRFMEANYNFSGQINSPHSRQNYIASIPDPKKHMENEYRKLLEFFEPQIKRGDLEIGNIRTFVVDFKDLSLWQVAGSEGGWRKAVHDLASLEPGEVPYPKRIEPQKPQVLAITHPNCGRRSTVPLVETLGLPRYLSPGMTFVTTSEALAYGRVTAAIHASLFYYAEFLKGKWVHVRGMTQEETNYFFDQLMLDPLSNWVLEKYGLKIKVHNNAMEEELAADSGKIRFS
jgi:hypothetical protein